MRLAITSCLVAVTTAFAVHAQENPDLPAGDYVSAGPGLASDDDAQRRPALLAQYLDEVRRNGEQRAARMTADELELETALLRYKTQFSQADADLADLEVLLSSFGEGGFDGAAEGAAKAAELRRITRDVSGRVPADAAALKAWDAEQRVKATGHEEVPTATPSRPADSAPAAKAD